MHSWAVIDTRPGLPAAEKWQPEQEADDRMNRMFQLRELADSAHWLPPAIPGFFNALVRGRHADVKFKGRILAEVARGSQIVRTCLLR